jgi:WD40 repeat protein
LYTEVVLSHKEAVTCCLYNKHFKQLVSCTEASIVKLWDLETGKAISEFSSAHGDSAITCMTFDETDRRLITGGRDGTSKIWNYNNGHCLKTLQKDNILEVNDVKYLRIYNNKFIISVGWDRRINIYDDDSEDVKFYINPNEQWDDDREQGHKEDIICIGKSESNLLATASYDGEIIVWNLVSGHIFSKIQSPKPNNHHDTSLDGDLSVNKIIFLNRENYMQKNCAHLIASGPYGMVHFWSVFSGVELYARFKVVS